MKKFAVILAGGVGLRAGSSVPKQLLDLQGRPVLWWSMHAFMMEDPSVEIILVMNPGLFDDWDIAYDALPDEDKIPYTLCCGGRSRTESVANAMITLGDLLREEGIAPEEAKVAVHDAARPLIDSRLIADGWKTCGPGICSVPAVDCSSSLREVTGIGTDGLEESRPVDRSRFREVQTPQTALAADFMAAYANPPEGSFTDDASLLQDAGCRVKLFKGTSRNLKITYPDDITIARALVTSDLKKGE